MTLQEYFESQPRGSKVKMARTLGITKNWVSQLIAGEKRASAELVVAINKYTRGKVSKKHLRPDLFG
jgi:DNA-binding transcriptional regulator YdaS (Cro superfamily)